MKKRQRKKWLKQHNQYVDPKETWDLDCRIAEFVIPRLRMLKKDSIAYPEKDEADTPEKWNDVLDKIIIAFSYVLDDDWWINNPKYDFSGGICTTFVREGDKHRLELHEEKWVEEIYNNFTEETERRENIIKEGLELFAKYFRYLNW